MLGLLIRDEIRWHDRWSSEIGRRFAVKDSTDNMIIFDERHSRDEILSVLQDAPTDIFQILDLQESPEDECDYMLDSGKCYSRKH